MGHLRAYYEKNIQLQEADWAFIAAFFQQRILQKGEVLLKHGRQENHLTFIESGIIRYYIPGDEKELTFNFSFSKEFACAYDSFLTRTASEYELQALTSTIAWQISYEDLQQVYAHTQAGNYLGRLASEHLFLTKSRRELGLLKYSARERYTRLFDERPDILRHIPMKYIASYIGITPQALSRIRRQIS